MVLRHKERNGTWPFLKRKTSESQGSQIDSNESEDIEKGAVTPEESGIAAKETDATVAEVQSRSS